MSISCVNCVMEKTWGVSLDRIAMKSTESIWSLIA
jgi:hypothetical protein